MTDNFVAFPPEYEDKIYIYKQTVDTDTFLLSEKSGISGIEYTGEDESGIIKINGVDNQKKDTKKE